MPHFPAQVSSCCRSRCRMTWSACDLICLYRRQSSAKSLIWDFTVSGISLMWHRKRRYGFVVVCTLWPDCWQYRRYYVKECIYVCRCVFVLVCTVLCPNYCSCDFTCMLVNWLTSVLVKLVFYLLVNWLNRVLVKLVLYLLVNWLTRVQVKLVFIHSLFYKNK